MIAYTSKLFRAESWQLQYLFSIGRISWWVHIAVVVLTALVLGWGLPAVKLWGTSMVVLSMAMVGVCTYGDRRKEAELLRSLGWVHSLLTFLIAVNWAAGGFIAGEIRQDLLLAYTFALGGTALGAVSTQHMLMRSCLISVWGSVPGLAIAYWILGEQVGVGFQVLMLLLYAAVLSVVAARMYRALLTNRQLSDALQARLLELSQEKRRVEEISAAKSRLMAYVSHDLRHPLHALSFLVEILKGHSLQSPTRTLVNRIENSVFSLTQLFQSLLNVSALELKQIKPTLRTFDIGLLLQDLAANYQSLAQSNGSTIQVLSPRCQVTSDPVILSNILQNLLANAIKYAPGKRITLGVRRRGKAYSLVVLDHGSGIEESRQIDIFRDFIRGDADPLTAEQGVGLGLPLVKRFALLLQLDCHLRSRKGVGTLVEITGIKPADITVHENQLGQPDPLAGQSVVLMGEDTLHHRQIRQLLSGWGLEVDNEKSLDSDRAPLAIVFAGSINEVPGLIRFRKLFLKRWKVNPPTIFATEQAMTVSELGMASHEVLVVGQPFRARQLRSALTSLTLVAV